MSAALAKRLGLSWVSATSPDNVTGVGGTVNILGHLTCPVKLGKRQYDQQFLVVQQSIAGYDCLLGEDFLAAHNCGVFFHDHSVHFTVECDAQGVGTSVYRRRLEQSQPTALVCDQGSTVPNDIVLDDAIQPDCGLMSHRERRRLLKEISSGVTVAYRVIISPTQTVVAVDGATDVPGCIKSVLKKHSADGGTLCGAIPNNTHAKLIAILMQYSCKGLSVLY
jgi:hypothetical protein